MSIEIEVVAAGPPGPRGYTGNTGPTGPQGAKGDKGDTGNTGAKGDKGDTGNTGAKGDKGDTGNTGAKGDKGDTGAKGDKGDTGNTGAKGDKGDQGDQGVIGPTPSLSIGTVGTGTAAASLTGTSEAPVLNLTLPSAGANGVNTAAIQDAAVTAAKLGSDVRIGNLLTTAQAGVSSTGLFTLTGCTEGAAGVFTANTTGVFGARYNVTTDITPGQTYTFTATIAPVGRAMHIYVQWYDAGLVALLGSFSGNTIAAGSSGVSTFTGVAPANAGYVRFYAAYGASGNNGDTVTVTKFGWWKGTGGTWAMPGQPILGLTDAPIGNLLTLNQATAAALDGFRFYNAASTWTPTLSSGKVRMTKDATGSVAFRVGVGGGISSGSSAMTAGEIPVTPGTTYTATAKVQSSAGISGTVVPTIYWWTSAGNVAASTASVAGAGLAASTSEQVGTVSAVAPANAAFASFAMRGSGLTGNASETIDVWDFSFHRGAAGVYAPPGLPIVGQSHIATNGAVHLSGTGSPEGVVTAAPGSTWLQTDATTDVKGWIRWVKATGTGNTGWQAGAEADTGWRDVTASVTGTASGSLHIRRTANVVTLRFISLELNSGSGPVPLCTFATGFKVITSALGALRRQTDQTKLQHIWVDPTSVSWQAEYGSVAWTTTHPTGAGSGMTGVITHTTTDAWPSSLPGSAA
jgi:hypothetical protein